VGKVTVRMAAAPPTGDGTHPAPGAVLITGGLGALGALLATWLAKRSATLRLLLVGRTGHLPPGVGAQTLQELISGRAGGGVVTLRMGDTASAADAAAACRTGSGKQPPCEVRLGSSSLQTVRDLRRRPANCATWCHAICLMLTAILVARSRTLPLYNGSNTGVSLHTASQAWFHAAGVLQDGLLANQTAGMLRQSFAAKSHAASNLHIVLGRLPLSSQVCACAPCEARAVQVERAR